MNTALNWHLASPEIILLTLLSGVLLVGLYLDQKKQVIVHWMTLATLVVVFISLLNSLPNKQMFAFSELFVVDPISQWLKIFLVLVTFIVLLYSHHYLKRHAINNLEYYVLTLFALLGMMVMTSSAHLLSLYIGLELLSLSLYTLVAIQRDTSRCSEAAMKYFIMGAVASGVLLYGVSIVYGVTHSFNLYEIAEFITKTITASNNDAALVMLGFALVFIVPALAFKLGAAPFHMWLPDVYHGAPTSVTLFVSTAPKIAALGMFIRVLVEAMPGLVEIWQPYLFGIAILSMAIGNIIAIAQTNIKRMFAYSAIAHMGFFLLGILTGQASGVSAAMFYMLIYVLMSLGVFGLLVLLKKGDQDIEEISDLAGLSKSHPIYAFILLLLVFSMAGVPPTVGFYAKLSVLKSVVEIDQIWLAVVAVFFSIIGAYYYLRVIKVMYFDSAQGSTQISHSGTVTSSILLSINGLAILGLGVFPAVLMELCQQLFNGF